MNKGADMRLKTYLLIFPFLIFSFLCYSVNDNSNNGNNGILFFPGCFDNFFCSVLYYDKYHQEEMSMVRTYSESLKKEKETFYNKNHEIIGFKTFSYDQKGNLIEESEYSADNTIIKKHVYVYTPDNVLIRKESMQSNEYAVYNYNSTGNNVLEKQYKNNELIFIIKYIFNVKNQLIMQYNYKSKGNQTLLTGYRKFIYNTRGDLVKNIGYNPDGSFWEFYYYIYNQEGRLIKKEYYLGEILDLYQLFSYDCL